MNRSTNRSSGLTLIEVLVSAAIVSGITLVLLSANVPVTRASTEVGVAFDLDRAAGKFLYELRREVRQSGYNLSASTGLNVRLVSILNTRLGGSATLDGGNSTLRFRHRRSFGRIVNDLNTSNWSREINYELAASPQGTFPDGTARYMVRRNQAGLTVDVLDHVRSLQFTETFAPNADLTNPDAERVSIRVALTLARENPAGGGTTPASRMVIRSYAEDIELLNKRQ